LIAELLEPYDISTDSVEIAELTTPLPPAPKTAFSARLSQTPELPGQSCREATQAGQGKLRRRERDPDSMTWTWDGTGGRGTRWFYAPLSDFQS